GALAVYQNGEFESAARTLRAIVEDLEELPGSEAAWSQWTRAMMRLSHVHLTLKQRDESDAVQVALLKVDSTHQLDPVLYAPGFRAHFEELRQRVRTMPKRRLTVTARGRPGTIYVSGRDIGATPATVILPAGVYRVAGAAGGLRIPSFPVDLTGEDRTVVLDFALAEAIRPAAGPGLVLAPAERASAIIRAGAWLGADRLVVASRAVEGEAQFLVGAIYDVRRGALLREGSVRMASGGVPAGNLGALAAFLLTGQSSREVLDRTHELVAAKPGGPRVAAAGTPAAAPSPRPSPPVGEREKNVQAAAAAASAPASAPSTASVPATAPASAAAPAPASAPSLAPAPSPRPSSPVGEREKSVLAAPAAAPASEKGALAAAEATPKPAPDLRPSPPAVDPIADAVKVEPAGLAARPAWFRPAAYGGGALAAVLALVAVQQSGRASAAYRDAASMVYQGPSGTTLKTGFTKEQHDAAIDRGDGASQSARLAAGGALASAAASGLLAWLSRDAAP
ncbi:MAG TPA: hypothetical protein VFP50_18725, partial [Anaeromyxobacteraceae bacterium]|nr:hypothetical protein [Anaeromyxobacteraceae bacterium]